MVRIILHYVPLFASGEADEVARDDCLESSLTGLRRRRTALYPGWLLIKEASIFDGGIRQT